MRLLTIPEKNTDEKRAPFLGITKYFLFFGACLTRLKVLLHYNYSPINFCVLSFRFLMIAIYFVNWSLIGDLEYQILFVLQNLFYLMAIIGGLARNQKYGIIKIICKVCYIPYVFCLLNFSALIGFLRFAGAKQEITWEKARE